MALQLTVALDGIYKGFMDQIVYRLSEPAAIYLLWPTIILLIIVQYYTSKKKTQRKLHYVERQMSFTKGKLDAANNVFASGVATVKESFFEEQPSFESDAKEYGSFLTNDDTICSLSDNSFRFALPKVQPEIVKFSEDDVQEGIGIETVAKQDSLLVRKVTKGSAACGRVCAGDRISAVNGISFTGGKNLGEKLQKEFKKAVAELQPFDITIIKGSRLSDVGIRRKSRRLSMNTLFGI